MPLFNRIRAHESVGYRCGALCAGNGGGRGAGFVGPDTALWIGSARAQSRVCRIGTSVTDGADVSLALGGAH